MLSFVDSSKDCINWNMLTPATDEAKELALLCQGRFTGDPSNEFEVTKYQTVDEGTEDEAIEENKVDRTYAPVLVKRYCSLSPKFQLREEDRLAATLWKIEQDALIIPRGAYVLQPNGHVERNRSFEGKRHHAVVAHTGVPTRFHSIGLTPAESGKLSNYFHFREPIRLQQKSLTHRAALDKSLHFLDTIDEDIPKGTCNSRCHSRNSEQKHEPLLLYLISHFQVGVSSTNVATDSCKFAASNGSAWRSFTCRKRIDSVRSTSASVKRTRTFRS